METTQGCVCQREKDECVWMRWMACKLNGGERRGCGGAHKDLNKTWNLWGFCIRSEWQESKFQFPRERKGWDILVEFF